MMTDSYVLPSSASWTVPSGTSEPGLRVSLALPGGRATGAVQTLVLLDGDFLFLTAVEFARTLHLVTLGDFPPLAIVGVMRDESDPMSYVTSRMRDFTPKQWVLPGPFEPDNAMASKGTGGAPEFLELIEQRVMPGIAERMDGFGLQMGELAIGGWSLSGLFATWAWLENPDRFSHLLAISPSLWWGDANILQRPIAPRSDSNKVFVGVGEHEEGDVELVYPRRFAHAEQREFAAMVRNAATFSHLAEQAGANVKYQSLHDEHHVTVQAVAIARGLRHLYA